ncbi:DinB family protein [Flavihumibacter sp. UBA7668]|uniref:DinB family protein n=1 Tax=Flavihumibacter sp. UBA7668 TaxID=1946542 RepID=UPI0025C04790|nr:DinB family protein [Flavihumibacter sp. UBA7668]
MQRFITYLLLISISVFLRFTAAAQQTDSLFLKAAIERLEHSKNYTLAVAQSMPDKKYSYRPSPEEMSFAEQLIHISGNLAWLSTSYLSGAVNPISEMDKKAISKKEVMDVVTKTYDYALQVLRQFKSTQLADTVSFFAGPLNKLQIINLLNDHQSHHRGQLLVYLRLNGIKPPAYTGW